MTAAEVIAFDAKRAPRLLDGLPAAADEGLGPNVARLYGFLAPDPAFPWVEAQSLNGRGANPRFPESRFAHASSADGLAALAHKAEAHHAPGVYVIANRIDPAVTTREESRGHWLTAQKGASTTDGDIARRMVAFFDVDAERARGASATDEEKAHARSVAGRVLELVAESLPLASIGVGDSGNGYSVFVALDALPNTPEVENELAGALAALDLLVATDRAKVDRSVKDAKRLVPLFGTMKRKGAPGIPERPHRRTAFVCAPEVERVGLAEFSRFVDALAVRLPPEKRAEVDKARGRKVVQKAAETTATTDTPFSRANAVPTADVLGWLGLMNGDAPVCPGCRSQDSGVAIVRGGLKCSHDRCSQKGVAKGFRTNADLVAEEQRITPREAVGRLAERFGFEGFAVKQDQATPRADNDPRSPAPRYASAITLPDSWPDEEPETQFLVRSLQIAIGRPTLFNGPGGAGKSLVAQYVAACQLGGVGGLGGLIEPGPKRRVVHIDGDQGVSASRRRYRRLCATLGVGERPTLVSLLHAMSEGFNPADVTAWAALFSGHELAIIDSLSSVVSVAGLDENAASDTKKILATILAASEAERCAVILITHTGHDSDDGRGNLTQRKRPRGSSAVIQGAGAIWTFTGSTERGAPRLASLERESEQDDGGEILTRWQFVIGARRDVQTPGMQGAPGFDIVRTEDTIDGREEQRRREVTEKILATLAKQRHHTSGDGLISAAGAGNKDFARATLASLVGEGVVVKHRKAFRLASDLEAEDAQEVLTYPDCQLGVEGSEFQKTSDKTHDARARAPKKGRRGVQASSSVSARAQGARGAPGASEASEFDPDYFDPDAGEPGR